jgi:hypothetical protein
MTVGLAFATLDGTGCDWHALAVEASNILAQDDVHLLPSMIRHVCGFH